MMDVLHCILLPLRATLNVLSFCWSIVVFHCVQKIGEFVKTKPSVLSSTLDCQVKKFYMQNYILGGVITQLMRRKPLDTLKLLSI